MATCTVVGDGPEFGVQDDDGGLVYDLLSRQEAEDIAGF